MHQRRVSLVGTARCDQRDALPLAASGARACESRPIGRQMRPADRGGRFSRYHRPGHTPPVRRTSLSRNTRWLWGLNHALLGALVLLLFHALIMKLYRDAPLMLTAWLLLVFFVVVVNGHGVGRTPAQYRVAVVAQLAVDDEAFQFLGRRSHIGEPLAEHRHVEPVACSWVTSCVAFQRSTAIERM